MTIRKYSSRSQQTTLTGAITSGATSMTVVSGTALLGGVTISAGTTFTLVLDVDTAIEEIVDATAVSTNTFTITRAIDGSTAQDHSAGAVVRHMAIGRDYRDANTHTEADAYYNDGAGAGHTMHGIGSGEGVVVGTLKTQTLTNKTLTAPTISDPVITGVIGGAGITFEGSTADAHETTLTVADPTQDNTITLPNTTGTVVIDSATQTLTNKTLTSPTISGSPVITGLSSAGMVASSAAPKDYVDSILGSATSAATSAASAATSAASAATSASSASTSASSALTSANSASTSATAAATSATSAAASATAAATSATSASNSASAASTSATSADTSASSASTSASSALTSANSASTSASSALTSANSAATSASSAAASYDSFDDRYLGAKSSPPTVDNDGNALLTGALYWNTSVNKMYVWSGTAWGEISSSADIIAYKYTATNGQTSVSGADDNGLTLSYVVGKEQVYINGVLQVRGSDYTATTGSSITGLAALTVNDIVTVLAFTAFSVSNTIASTTFTAKGDVLTASAAGTPAVRSAGTDGTVLTADSSQSTGLIWTGVNQMANPVINGGFDVWQRGTSGFVPANNATTFAADRWLIYRGVSGSTVSRQTISDSTNLPNLQYAMRVARDSGNTSTSTIDIATNVETANAIPFANKTVTLSFYARAGANYSAASSALYAELRTGTGTDQSTFSTYTGSATPISSNVTLTTTWQRFALTATLASTTTEFALKFVFTPVGTAGANDWYEISGVQVDFGTYTASTAPTFRRSGGTIQGELAAASRYYYRVGGSNVYERFAQGYASSTTNVTLTFNQPVTMRVAPTAVDFSTIIVADGSNIHTVTGLTIDQAGKNVTSLNAAVASGLTQFRPYGCGANNSTNAYIGLSAEL